MKAKTRNLGGWWTFLEGSKYLAGAEMVVHFLFKIIILLVMDQHWNWTLFYLDGEKMVKLMVVNSSGNDPLNMTWQSFLLKMVQQARRGSTLKVIVTTSLPDNDVTATVWDEHSNSNFWEGVSGSTQCLKINPEVSFLRSFSNKNSNNLVISLSFRFSCQKLVIFLHK